MKKGIFIIGFLGMLFFFNPLKAQDSSDVETTEEVMDVEKVQVEEEVVEEDVIVVTEEEEVVEPTTKPTIGIPTIAFASIIKALAKERFNTKLTQNESFVLVKELEDTYKNLVS